ncbi:MAG: FdtA/QdtA family cupin domain-containing protein [Alphaproteobacteria bacterium]|nr:FdtA/QdtA family cupin domain-containing protein [Alphaproteobacteria bacterium]
MIYEANVDEIDFSIKGDARGYLVPFEDGVNMPFAPKRFYYLYGTDTEIQRGFHAHKELKQLLIATSGSVRIQCEWNGLKKKFLLDSPTKGLLLEGMVWHVMDKFSPDCILSVLASDIYNEADYVRNYDDFKKYEAEYLNSF